MLCCHFTCAERWRALTRHFQAMDPRSASDSHHLKHFGNGEHKQHLCDFFQNTNKLTFPLSHGSQCHWKRKNYELSQFQFAPNVVGVSPNQLRESSIDGSLDVCCCDSCTQTERAALLLLICFCEFFKFAWPVFQIWWLWLWLTNDTDSSSCGNHSKCPHN